MSDRCRCGHLDRIHLSSRYACRLTYQDALTPGRQSALRDSCNCDRFRPERWTDAHTWWRHPVVRLWLTLPHRARWWIAERIHGADPANRCWCDIVDSVIKADGWEDTVGPLGYRSMGYRHDYEGPGLCLCDFPLPWECGKPRPGFCYCPPPAEEWQEADR